ncbi:chaperonin 10-like protein [Zopfochytrium polystomum]|nr:chaperonin 10-like protein [Zopfochytrium polystomum]
MTTATTNSTVTAAAGSSPDTPHPPPPSESGRRTHHAAVVSVADGAPLELRQVPTRDPAHGEVLMRVEWVASTPLDLHRADGGLLRPEAGAPVILGSSAAGTVVAVGPGVDDGRFAVFGFAFQRDEHRSQQEFVTVPAWTLGRLPASIAPEQAVTVPTNLVTAFHVLTEDLGLLPAIPWPLPNPPTPPRRAAPILVWGAASSVGLYVVQVLRLYGFASVLAVASTKHHDRLRALGAAWTGDYNDPNVAQRAREAAAALAEPQVDVTPAPAPAIPFIVDCIGSLHASVAPIAREIADPGARVAVMLPVVIDDPKVGLSKKPEYSMDPTVAAASLWKPGVDVRGTRTHGYMKNEFFKTHLQPSIVPALLARGLIAPNTFRVVPGASMLERAENALGILRRKEVSGEKLVWMVAEDKERDG